MSFGGCVDRPGLGVAVAEFWRERGREVRPVSISEVDDLRLRCSRAYMSYL